VQEVSTNMKNELKCRKIEAYLPDLLLDPEAVKPSVHEHLASCADCQSELASLRSTMSALDAWTAPEPSPYFDTRMQAKLRAAKEAEPEGFWERMRARLLFSTNFHLRTAGAAALAALLAVGGGSALYVSQLPTSHPPVEAASATVQDLQALDGNAQVFQQLNAVDAGDTDSGNDTN
jgi:anti-sigma factor RsiW